MKKHFFFFIVISVFFPIVGKAQSSDKKYEIIEIEDQSTRPLEGKSLSDFSIEELTRLPMAERIRVRVALPTARTEGDVRKAIDEIVKEKIVERPDLDAISFLIYSSKEQATSVPDLGSAIWAPGGALGNITADIAAQDRRDGYQLVMNVDKRGLEAAKARTVSETKSNLTEQQRREIYTAMAQAEDKAQIEADKKHPTNPDCVSQS